MSRPTAPRVTFDCPNVKNLFFYRKEQRNASKKMDNFSTKNQFFSERIKKNIKNSKKKKKHMKHRKNKNYYFPQKNKSEKHFKHQKIKNQIKITKKSVEKHFCVKRKNVCESMYNVDRTRTRMQQLKQSQQLQQQSSQRVGALSLIPSCLGIGGTPVGPGKDTHGTLGPLQREAVGGPTPATQI